MSEKTKAANTQNGDGSTVGQIKDILFGKEIRRFNKQFQDIKKQLDENKRVFDNKIQLLSEEIAGNLSNLDASIEAKLKTNQAEMLQEIQKLNKEKIDGKKLKEVLQKMAEEV